MYKATVFDFMLYGLFDLCGVGLDELENLKFCFFFFFFLGGL